MHHTSGDAYCPSRTAPTEGSGSTDVMSVWRPLNLPHHVYVGTLLHRIIRRHLEQVSAGLATPDIGELVNGLAHSGIALLRHHYRLKLRRVPPLCRHVDRPLITDLLGGDGQRGACALSHYPFDHFGAERLFLDVGVRR